MSNCKSYQFKALNAESYQKLAEQVVALDCNTCLLPNKALIVVTPLEFEEVHAKIRAIIEREGLDFHIEPVEKDNIREILAASGGIAEALLNSLDQRYKIMGKQELEINELKKKLSITEYERDQHKKQAQEVVGREEITKKQLKAIITLLGSITE